MAIQDNIVRLVEEAVGDAQHDGHLPVVPLGKITVERPQNPEHGDFACTLPLKLAGPMRSSPLKIAEAVVSRIHAKGPLERVWAAPPGFINFALSPAWLSEQVEVVRRSGGAYGNSEVGLGQRVQVEFVSVNPTGPLHIGHARGAVFGSALANVLEAAGYQVQREYYVNDAGSQMERFNRTLAARYRQQLGEDAQIPDDGYPGHYMVDLAHELHQEHDGELAHLDDEGLAKKLGEAGLSRLLGDLRNDLADIRVHYDEWFSERSLYDGGQYDAAMRILRDGGYVTEYDGAVWFRSEELGDDQDKVLVRRTGAPTYIASDVAYHYNKLFERNFDRVIDVWGADHQGNAPFLRAMTTAIGADPARLDLLLYQLVTIKRGDETVRISKRTGDLITLREVVDEVGADACRYFFLARSPESQMEFDLELAKKETPENPVYYVQYAHARIASILRLAAERGVTCEDGDVSLLGHEAELALIRKILLLPELVETMASTLQPHHLPHYSLELATAFHLFYERCRVLSSEPEDLPLTKARLKLVDVALIVLARCLDLMSMEAPEEM